MGQISSKRKILLSCKLIDSVPTSFAPRLLLHAEASIVVDVVSQPPQFDVMAHKKVGKKRRTTLQTLLKYRHDAHSKISFTEDFHNSSSSISLHVCVCEREKTVDTSQYTPLSSVDETMSPAYSCSP